ARVDSVGVPWYGIPRRARDTPPVEPDGRTEHALRVLEVPSTCCRDGDVSEVRSCRRGSPLGGPYRSDLHQPLELKPMKNHGPSRTYLTVNDALPDLAPHVLDDDELESPTGERVPEHLHQQITLTEPWDRYPRLGLRKASLPAQIAEAMWILSGRNDVEWLSYYLPRAIEFSDDGETWRGGYGPRLRNFGGRMFGDAVGPTIPVDQLDAVVRELRANPTSRRAVLGIWDPLMDARRANEGPWKDIPCNDFISFQSRLGELHAHVFVQIGRASCRERGKRTAGARTGKREGEAGATRTDERPTNGARRQQQR